jgi:hypothetical protein
MALKSVHPLYAARQPEWVEMRDLYAGETRVKDKGEEYLPATKGMKLDGMRPTQIGYEAYQSYLKRTVFPDYVRDAVEAYIGFMHQKAPTIELPEQMEKMRSKATAHGESLEMLLRRMNEEQLVTGRVGLLLDLPQAQFAQTDTLPYIALYAAESIRNWDDASIDGGTSKLNLVVLDESGYRRGGDNFEWDEITKFRVLQLGDLVENESPNVTAKYFNGAFESRGHGGDPTYVPSDMVMPVYRGTPLEEIPFVFVNTKDVVPAPDIPLLGLARIALAIYRGEADYRQNLFMQGQDTFVTIGDFQRKANVDLNEIKTPDAEADGLRTGAGSRIAMELGGDAKYVGVNGEGLTEQRESLQNDRKRAESRSGQLIDARKSGDTESGEALKTRVAAQTATLNQIAKTGAAGLELILKAAARWMGADESKVKVTPNLEFADFEISGKNLDDIMVARSKGAPISLRSIHDMMSDKGLTKMDYETERQMIEQEDKDLAKRGIVQWAGAEEAPQVPAPPQTTPAQT